ncbi:MAG: ABC transporter permease [Gemmatimonadota bacterium]
MDTLLYDLRTALRSLRKSPGFAFVVAGTLALGIGANTAIFGAVKAVVLQPLPYQAPHELVGIWSQWVGFPKTWVSNHEVRVYTNRNRTLASVGAWASSNLTFTDPSNPERVGSALLSEGLLPTLGVSPALGRGFTPEEYRDQASIILLGHRLWQRRFASDPGVLGQQVEIDGALREVVGVMPAGFRLPTDYRATSVAEVYAPAFLDLDPALAVPSSGGSHGLFAVGRRNPGVTLEAAGADLARIVDDLAQEGIYSPEMGFRVQVLDLRSDILGAARPALWVLLGAVSLVLLIACGNVANLLLASGRTRRSEMAVRSAVGGGRGRILRQLMLEYGLLALAGGMAGVALALVAFRTVLVLDPTSIPRGSEVGMDPAILGYAFGLTLMTLILAGLLPAIRAVRWDPAALLREGGHRDTGSRSFRRGQSLLVAGQMALAVTLLIGAGLMIRTFVGLTSIDPGFDAGQALTLRVSLPAAGYPDVASAASFHDEVLRQTLALPGVEQAAFGRILPLASEIGDWGMSIEGYTPAHGEYIGGDWQVVTDGYVEAMGIPVLQGRTFQEFDGPGSDELLVNQALVDRYFQGREVLGRRIVAMGDTAVVVGVLGNVTHNGITGEVKPKFYRLHRQLPDGLVGTARSMTLVVRAGVEPYTLLNPVREIIRARDPALAVSEVQSMDEVMTRAVGQSRLLLTLLGLFAVLALVLSVVGVYGVLVYTVTQRTREIGVRMALGAQRRRVVSMVVRQGMTMSLAGLGAGLLVALAVSRVLEGLLYGVAPRDTLTFVAVAGGFTLVALTAAYLPARRAAGTDPMVALRAE